MANLNTALVKEHYKKIQWGMKKAQELAAKDKRIVIDDLEDVFIEAGHVCVSALIMIEIPDDGEDPAEDIA